MVACPKGGACLLHADMVCTLHFTHTDGYFYTGMPRQAWMRLRLPRRPLCCFILDTD